MSSKMWTKYGFEQKVVRAVDVASSVRREFQLHYRVRTRAGTDIVHSHSSVEFHFCEDGRGYFRSGYQSADLNPGLVTMIFGPRRHRVRSQSGHEYCRSIVHIPFKLLEQSLAHLKRERVNILPNQNKSIIQFRPSASQYVDLIRVFRNIKQKFSRSADTINPIIALYIAELFYIVRDESVVTPSVNVEVNPYDDLLVSRAIQTIHQQRFPHVTVGELAAHLGVSRTHLWRLFIAVIGRSPKEYLLERQMETAKEYLENGLSVSHIAREMGFSSNSSFSRAFRSYVGVSPTVYVKN